MNTSNISLNSDYWLLMDAIFNSNKPLTKPACQHRLQYGTIPTLHFQAGQSSLSARPSKFPHLLPSLLFACSSSPPLFHYPNPFPLLFSTRLYGPVWVIQYPPRQSSTSFLSTYTRFPLEPARIRAFLQFPPPPILATSSTPPLLHKWSRTYHHLFLGEYLSFTIDDSAIFAIRFPIPTVDGRPCRIPKDNIVKFYAPVGRNSSLDGFRAFPRG